MTSAHDLASHSAPQKSDAGELFRQTESDSLFERFQRFPQTSHPFPTLPPFVVMEFEAAEKKKSLFKKVGKSLKKAKKSLTKSLSRKSLSRLGSDKSSTYLETPATPATARAAVDTTRHSEFAIRRSFSESDSRPLQRGSSSPFLQNLGEKTPVVVPKSPESSLDSEEKRLDPTGSDGWTEVDSVESTLDSSQTASDSPKAQLLHSVDSQLPTPKALTITPVSLFEEQTLRHSDNGSVGSGCSEELLVEVQPIVVTEPESEGHEPSGEELVQEPVELIDSVAASVTAEVESATVVIEDLPGAVEAEVVEVQDVVEVTQDERERTDDVAQDTTESIAPDASFQDEKVAEKQADDSDTEVAAECEESFAVVEDMSSENSAPVVPVAQGNPEATVESSPPTSVEAKGAVMTTEELFSQMGKDLTSPGSGSMTTEDLFCQMGKDLTSPGSGSKSAKVEHVADNAPVDVVKTQENVEDTVAENEGAGGVPPAADAFDARKLVSDVIESVIAANAEQPAAVEETVAPTVAAAVEPAEYEAGSVEVVEALKESIPVAVDEPVAPSTVVTEAAPTPVEAVVTEDEILDEQPKSGVVEDIAASDEEFMTEAELDVIPEGSPLGQLAPEVIHDVPVDDVNMPNGGVEEMNGAVPGSAVVDSAAEVEAADEEILGLDVAAKQSREFSLADVEAAKARRNSCSQAEDANRAHTADPAPIRQSVDVGNFQLQEDEGRGGARKRWRWVRKVVAPATVLTGAVLIGISKIR